VEINSSTWPSLNCSVCIDSDSCGYKANPLTATLSRDSLSAFSAPSGPRLLVDDVLRGFTSVHNHPQHASYVSRQSYAASKEVSVQFWTQFDRETGHQNGAKNELPLSGLSRDPSERSGSRPAPWSSWPCGATPFPFLIRQGRHVPFVCLLRSTSRKIGECLDMDSYLASSFVT
jgi:hypothetical protein